MKKTLALALVAAMTISMASMTAFAKNLYSPEDDKKIPEEVTAQVVLTEKEFKDKGGVVGEGTKSYKLAAHKKIELSKSQDNTGDAPVDLDPEILAILDGTKLRELIADGTIIEETIDGAATIKFEKLGLKTFENTATKTFFGWKDGTYQTPGTCEWKTDHDPKSTVYKDSDTITMTKKTETIDGDVYVYYTKDFATVGRIDTTDEAIAKNLENIENAKKDKEKAEANKKDLEKWDEEHNATNNVLKRDNDKDVLDTAEARVTKMGTKWDNKKAEYWGNDDYCRHAAQVIGLGDDAGDIYDIYSVEAPKGFLKGKSARITLEPITIKNPGDFNVTVYHVEGWCKAKKVKDFKIIDNKIVLWGDSFSPYVVVYEAKDAASAGSDASNPSTGDFSAVPVALLAAAALGATGFVAYKKRKAE
jgi:LPXTG-motif cell wall-anchored protein